MKIKGISVLRALLIVVGCLFIIIGIAEGEYKTALAKATKICLECIGIG